MPSNSLIGAIRVEASIDAGKFVSGARQLSNASKIAEHDVKAAFAGISSAIKGGIAGFTGALSVAGFVELVKGGLDYAKSLQTVSQQLGITTQELQTMRFAAAQVNVTQEQLDNGFQFLEKSIGKAIAGSQQAQKAFASVGVSLTDLETKSRAEIFTQVADGMAKQGGAARNAAAATAIFGKSASDLNPLLDQGSEGINNLADAARDLGVVLSDEQIRNANVTATKLTELKEVLQADIAGAVTDNANAIVTLADALAKLVQWTGQSIEGWKRLVAEFKAGVPAAVAALGISGASPAAALLAFGQAGDAARKEYDLRQLMSKGLAQFQADFPKGRPRTTGNVPQFLAPPRSGGRSRTGRQPADRSDEVTAQFEQEQLRADQAILQAKQQLAESAEERLALSVKLSDIDQQLANAEEQEKVAKAKRDLAEGKITKAAYDQVAAQAGIIEQKNAEKAAIEKQALVEGELAKAEQANFDAADQQYKFRLDALHSADDLATTAADHRRIQLQILDSEIAQRRYELEHEKQLAIRNGATAEEIKAIQDQIDHLPTQQAQGRAEIINSTQNPLEAWAKAIPKNAAEIKEALQSIEVEGLDGLSKAIGDVVTGTTSLKQAFHELAASVIQDLIQMTIKMLLFRAISAIGSAIGGSAAGGGSTDFSSFTSGFNGNVDFSNTPVTGFATGGSFMVGGRSGTDQNLLSLNGLPIAKVSHNERIGISAANDSDGSVPMLPPLTFYNDFRGADPDAVAAINARLDQFQKGFASNVVSAWKDARDRFVIR